MSSSSITDPGVFVGAIGRHSLGIRILNPIKRIAFWTAIVLPFLYLPLLATGLESSSTGIAFGVLVIVNVCALFLGHPHKRD